jgi:galactose-1-phosphate uridylyltransferase
LSSSRSQQAALLWPTKGESLDFGLEEWYELFRQGDSMESLINNQWRMMGETRDFADVFKRVLVKFDNLWYMPFPYVMPRHQAPMDGREYPGFHFHIEFQPPLRKPNLLKYLAGPEIGGGNFLSDTSAQEKAAELRAQSDLHYKHVPNQEMN